MKRPYSYTLALLVMLGCIASLPLGASSGAISPSFPQVTAPEPSLRPANQDTVKVAGLHIGIISYWCLSSTAWDRVPADSLVLINPEDGILKAKDDKAVPDSLEWAQLFERLKQKNVMVLGYVPTGYFDHVSCKKKPKPKCQTEARIRRQVETYYQLMPSLAGIFYDETSPKKEKGADYDKEYELLRSINMSGRITVFNVGTASDKAVKATRKGEHLVLFESSPKEYDDKEQAKLIAALTREARDNGIIVWHLMHSVSSAEDMCAYVAKMAERGANYGYVTNIGGDWENGDQTWNSLPPYWEEELAAFSAPGKPCAKK